MVGPDGNTRHMGSDGGEVEEARVCSADYTERGERGKVQILFSLIHETLYCNYNCVLTIDNLISKLFIQN